jgi:hypothetical protein
MGNDATTAADLPVSTKEVGFRRDDLGLLESGIFLCHLPVVIIFRPLTALDFNFMVCYVFSI